MMRRAATFVSRSTLQAGKRMGTHQDNHSDDLSWMEADNKMTREEKYAYAKQQALLQKHADALNAKYEEEHAKTRNQMENHQTKSAASVAALEAKIAELTSMIQQMKAEGK